MAVESFSELLQKLREVHEHELEVWQEKVLELTNKKNIDAKRMEELYNRNQQMREQQRILTENIKQLENRLRAGLCDRCTVTQDVAKKRQQEYDSYQIQSLQHISLLVSEMNALKKENDRLREELKGSKDSSKLQNGHSEDTITSDVNVSPDRAAAAVTLLSSGLKSSQLPPGDATVPVKRETDSCPTDSVEKATEHKLMQSWARAFSFESSKAMLPTSSPVRWGTEHGTERRAASVDSVEHRHSPLSPLIPSPLSLLKNNPIFSSAASEERSSRQQIHTPVPFRPLPIKTGRLSIPWSISESTDWVTVAAPGSAVSSGIAVNPNQSSFSGSNVLRFPKMVPPSSLQSRTHSSTPGGLRPWNRRNLSEHADSREKKVTEAGTAPTQWKASVAHSERIFGENLREEEEETPLDLSESGRSKSHETEKEKKHSQSDASSTLSSSPPVTLSSLSQCPSSPLSDQQTADNNAKEEARERCNEREEVKEGETSLAAFSSEKKKIPSLTISLQPVVVMEPLKTVGQAINPVTVPMEQEEKENNNLEASRKRSGQETDAVFQRSLKEKKIRLTRGSQGNYVAPDQG